MLKRINVSIIAVFLAAFFLPGALAARNIRDGYGLQQDRGQRPFSFAYLSDIHISEGSTSIADVEACIADINNNPSLEFAIFAGDITDFGADKELRLAKSLFDKLNIPYYVIAGNHDAKWSESGCNTFVKVFGYEAFEFDKGGIKFIGTNSGPNMRMAPALLPRESMVWLDSIARTIDSAQPVFFVNHYPMDTSMLNYTQVLDILKRMNTQLILNGHWHINRAMDYEGIPGAIGRSSMRQGKSGPGYNIVTVDGSSVIFSERIAPITITQEGKEIQKPGKTETPWYILRMSRGPAYDNGIRYPRPSFAVNEEYPNVKTIWKIQDNSDIGSGAVQTGDLVIYANTAGIVRALSAKDGSQVWSYKTGGKIYSTPAVSGGTVVIGSSDGNIYALNVNTGAVRWKFPADKSVLSSPSIYGGKVYIGASDGCFRALDLKTGRLVWSYPEVKGFVETKPFVDNEQVIFGDWANMLYSLDPKTGRLQWSWTNKKGRMFSPAAVWPVKANGKVFFVTPERATYALSAKTGWQFWTARGGRESIGLSPDKKKIYVKTMLDTVIAFSAEDILARKIWEVNVGFGYEIAPTPITSTPRGGKDGAGLVFIPTDKGNVIALNAKDGSIAWKHRLSLALVNYIQPLEGNRILVSTMDGVVALLEY